MVPIQNRVSNAGHVRFNILISTKQERIFMQLDNLLRKNLEKEEQILLREIRTLYAKFDRQFQLNSASVPITFGLDTDTLGSYTQASINTDEEFHFSLLFIGRSIPNPLSKEDRIDLYKHEYAHYMQYNMPIPREYTWQYGTHGSAWKYCCSLIGAAPTPNYKAGEGTMQHDYDKVLKNNLINDQYFDLKDNYRRKREEQKARDSVVRFAEGQEVKHPKYGRGTIVEIKEQTGAVRLCIRFGEEIKTIDQKWMLKFQR